MKQRMSSEFIYQLFALLIAVIVVHAVYVGAIRPAADAEIQREMALQAAGEDFVPERSGAREQEQGRDRGEEPASAGGVGVLHVISSRGAGAHRPAQDTRSRTQKPPPKLRLLEVVSKQDTPPS